ncbi:hypothetical protein ACA910_007774 [Epithemia clementina (nom. ined.)]
MSAHLLRSASAVVKRWQSCSNSSRSTTTISKNLFNPAAALYSTIRNPPTWHNHKNRDQPQMTAPLNIPAMVGSTRAFLTAVPTTLVAATGFSPGTWTNTNLRAGSFPPKSNLNSNNTNNNGLQLVLRRSFAWSKQKKKRMARIFQRKVMREAGIPVKKPPRYIDPKTPVINAVPREEQQRRTEERRKQYVLEFPEEMKKETGLPPLLLPFQTSLQETEESLTISPKVAKVLSLNNSTQQRVVQVQKVAGMKLFQLRPGDTGSSSVQIIALTARIQQMDTHMIMHPKDKSGKRGLAILRARRRKMLDYLERSDFPAYAKVVTTLGLK